MAGFFTKQYSGSAKELMLDDGSELKVRLALATVV